MERYLKPDKFGASPESPSAGKEFTHWLKTFENFIALSPEPLTSADRLKVFQNFLTFNVYELISETNTYEVAVETLTKIYVKQKGEIFARHILAIRKQQQSESIDQYIQTLRLLAKDCNFKAVTAEEHKSQYIRDSFINGLLSPHIRQRLLEDSKTLSLDDVIQRALALELAHKQAEGYSNGASDFSCAGIGNDSSAIPVLHTDTSASHSSARSFHSSPRISESDDPKDLCAGMRQKKGHCYFCGFGRHPRSACPALDSECANCGIKGHYARVCRKAKKDAQKTKTVSAAVLASLNTGFLPQLSHAVTPALVDGILCNCLIDTGSSGSFISLDFVREHDIQIMPNEGRVSMASTSLWVKFEGFVLVKLEIAGHAYNDCKLTVLKELCSDVLIGHDILRAHTNILLNFGGDKAPLTICSSVAAKIEPLRLFDHLSPHCRPIATRSRQYCDEDNQFIETEIARLLSEGVIEPSNSPWRAQVLVVNGRSKKRLVVDYSLTINRYTQLDAYPLPNIDRLVRKVANYKRYSVVDLSHAYHQIPICEDEKKYTGFEAMGKLYQFTRIPFGVTNGVACFQRAIDRIITAENLTGVYAYLDDITVCGMDKRDHDQNLNKLILTLDKLGIEINKAKSKFDQTRITLLGHLVSFRSIKPDPSRLAPLLNMPLPHNSESLKRALGFFAHYSKWIPAFSDKIKNLTNPKSFPLDTHATSAFENLKKDISNSVVTTIDEALPLVVETDASKFALAATLSQEGRPIAFFSRSLTKSEISGHPSIEKEAAAIVESLKHWRAFLLGRHFQLITDQEALSFIFDRKHGSKIKNEKITRWRLELAPFVYDITYRPGEDNTKADTLSRICNASSVTNLLQLHQSLCHPGVTRMYHWLRCKNLPYSLEDVKKMTAGCTICAEVKPRYLTNSGTLVKATSPFERINVDFKGPIPSGSRNFYMLTIIDEYSRFPFAYACRDVSAATVVECLKNLFCLFGTPAYVHSDRGASFMSREVKDFLHSNGVATSRTTPYNPAGNGQIERLNGTLWKTICLALKTQGLRTEDWEKVLQESLHAIRSLLCTATNATPHERFFTHSRRTANGVTMPSWLTPGPVLARRNMRHGKYEDPVEEVELLEANPQYALIRKKDGAETTVSLRQLAPRGTAERPGHHVDEQRSHHVEEQPGHNVVEPPPDFDHSQEKENPDGTSTVPPYESGSSSCAPTPRPRRVTKPPAYLKDYETY